MNNAPQAPDTPLLFIARVGDAQCDAMTDQTLLQSLEQGGIDWPSSCRNGTCRTCLGQLLEGSVRYAVDWPGLSAEEKAEGCVLPCVAFPLSDLVLEGPGI
ncbi:MAG: 2Fe-2S iron-sulfur cluster-binding protein [Burkholderiaceae bacterium]|nr:2Fe-2S iron-sulfur cluster-binding protein [Burkholderiaceae bacterium]